MIVSIGPWQRYTRPYVFHGPPVGAWCGLDLTPLPEQAKDNNRQSLGIFLSDVPLADCEMLASEDVRDAAASARAMDAIQGLFGYRPQGAKLADCIWDCLVGGSDPTGQAGPKPLLPRVDRVLELLMGGVQLKTEPFAWGKHPLTNRIRDVLRDDFRDTFGRSQTLARKRLDDWQKKYRVDDWREFVPLDMRGDVPGPLPRETTITESFNTADSATLGPDLTWTDTEGDLQVVSNRAQAQGSGQNNSQANSDLSSADHYAQVEATGRVNTSALAGWGVACRFTSSENSAYLYMVDRGYLNQCTIYKVITDSYTLLSNDASSSHASDPTGQIVKLTVNGTSLTGNYDGSNHTSTTDSSFTTPVRCGICAYNHVGTPKPHMDNFQAADLAAAVGSHPLPRRSRRVRNLLRM